MDFSLLLVYINIIYKLIFFRYIRAARRTELVGATSMEGIATVDWTQEYAEKSPLQISSTDVQKEITLANFNPKAPAEGKPTEAGAKKV